MSEKIWKVAVLGAAGRMGSEAVRAVNTAAGYGPGGGPGPR